MSDFIDIVICCIHIAILFHKDTWFLCHIKNFSLLAIHNNQYKIKHETPNLYLICYTT
nr:MAG TPA: hypothetical protein [Caudoviricetes sp.]